MTDTDFSILARRTFLTGAAGASIMLLPGCASGSGLDLVGVIKRLLQRSASNAFAALTQPGGFYDNQLARLDLPDMLGGRGDILQNVLTSAVFKGQLEKGLNSVAEAGAKRAAPIVAEAVQNIGIDNALGLIQGGPTAATAFLRNAMSGSLISAMIPALGDGLRLASNPIVSQVIGKFTGVDLANLTQSLSSKTDNSIWGEIGRQETAIRANPASTNDPLLIAVLKTV